MKKLVAILKKVWYYHIIKIILGVLDMIKFLRSFFKKNKKTETKSSNKAHCKKMPSSACSKNCEKRTMPEKSAAEQKTLSNVLELQSNNTVAVEEPQKAVIEENQPEVAQSVKEESDDTSCEEKEGKGSFVIKPNGDAYVFVLKSPNGDNIITSGEYTLKRSCVSGIQSVKNNGATPNIEDQTAEKIEKQPHPKYELCFDDSGKYRFRLKAPNGYMILLSSAYNSKKSCLKAIQNVRAYSQTDLLEDMTKNK